MDEEIISYKIIPKKVTKFCCCPNESFSMEWDKTDTEDTTDSFNSSTISNCPICTMIEDEMKEYLSLVPILNLDPDTNKYLLNEYYNVLC